MFVQKMKFEEGKELVIGQIPRHLIFQLGYLKMKIRKDKIYELPIRTQISY